ncbi:hypothetical protein BBJ28_00012937 [Nothophytophthora sp. Chile5]|nr:hypothetical protein BBJ28_00012937 [Nothophytophthora sp. Chile5]
MLHDARRGSPGADETPMGSWEFSGAFCVGRSRNCEVSIATSEDTRTVSKRHVGVIPLAETLAASARAGAGPTSKRRWLLYDLETMNGTAVNGVELPSGGSQELRDGDEVVLASAMRQCVRLVVQFPDDACSRICVKALARSESPPRPHPSPREASSVAAPVVGLVRSASATVVASGGCRSVADAAAAPHSLPQKRSRSGSRRAAVDNENAETNVLQDTPTSQQRKRSRRGIEQDSDVAGGATATKEAQEHERQERERLMLCPVCLEYFHGSATLPCSHTFCGYCISNWFRTSLSCPECRDVVKTVPVRNRALDELVERLVGRSEAYKTHVRRRTRLQRRSIAAGASREERGRGEDSDLDEDESIGATRGVGSLQLGFSGAPVPSMRSSVFARWSVEEKLAFSAYVSAQFGESRVATCKKVGLTEAAVDGANGTELLIAAQNLLLDCGGLRIVGEECCQRLKIFLLFG